MGEAWSARFVPRPAGEGGETRRPQEAPKMPYEDPSEALRSPRPPKMPEDATKTPLRCLKEEPKMPPKGPRRCPRCPQATEDATLFVLGAILGWPWALLDSSWGALRTVLAARGLCCGRSWPLFGCSGVPFNKKCYMLPILAGVGFDNGLV